MFSTQIIECRWHAWADSMKIGRLGLISTLLVTVISCTGCPRQGEYSWQHYEGGGHFPARTPSMSPDGAQIAYSSPSTGHGDVYLVGRDGTQRRRLTNDPAFETDPLFSPDGSTIAYSREVDGRRHIWLMDADGTNQRQLTSGRVIDDVVSFTPGGQELNINRSPLSFGMGRVITPFAVNLASGRVRQLQASPVYSASGRTSVYQRFGTNGRPEIWVSAPEERFLVAGYSPRTSVNGKRLLYCREPEHPGSQWRIIDVDGSNDQELGLVADPVFASDGQHVICLSPEWRRQVLKIDLTTMQRTRLEAPTGYIDFFRRCPEGFIFKLVTDDRVGDIYVINTETWQIERVTSMN